jgi:hypothetical protein
VRAALLAWADATERHSAVQAAKCYVAAGEHGRAVRLLIARCAATQNSARREADAAATEPSRVCGTFFFLLNGLYARFCS